MRRCLALNDKVRLKKRSNCLMYPLYRAGCVDVCVVMVVLFSDNCENYALFGGEVVGR